MTPIKNSRRSFTKEFKLKAISYYYDNGKNMNATANKFHVDRKQIRNWVQDEEKIQKLKHRGKANRYRRAKFPLMENELFTLFTDMRKEGRRIKRWWFNAKAKELTRQMYPDEVDSFKLSHRWFEGFCRRKNISLRRKTHASQKAPEQLRNSIENFHAKLLRERRKGNYTLRDLANMDQTPLPFVLDDNKTYDKKGADEVWIASGASGLEKRQCTVQLTIFADGSTLPPLLISRGKVSE